MSTKHAILSILLILAPFVTCQSNSYLQEDQQKYLDRFDSLIADSYAEPIPAEMRAMCAKQAKLPATIPEISIPSDMNSDAAQKICSPAATCIIPAGVTVSMNSNLNVGRLIVRGTLIWTDTTQVVAAQWLCAGIVAVEDNGQFKMNVALKKAIIYVKSNSATHDILGTRVFGGVTTTASKPGFPVIDIAGRKLERTWSLLSQAAATGESAIRLMHNPGYMGWTVGDRIVIAPTTHGSTGTASNHVIKSIAGNTVTLTTPLLQSFTFATQYGYATGNAGIMSAEVINLTRSILMTGDDFEHVPCTSLLNNPSLPPAICTYGAHFSMALGGLLKLQYTRLEKCGQRGVKGKYCVHMHMMSNCPDCLVKGNAVEFGQQRGITIHGTHLSTVEDNVLNDIRGVGLYIEDGNEMYNNVLYNVVICPWALDGPKGGCSVPGTDQGQADTSLNQAGIWAISPSNTIIGNRASNSFNGMFYDPGNNGARGQGAAQDNICPQDSIFVRLEGNTFHGHSRFGSYFLGAVFPKKTDQSFANNGLLTDPKSCRALLDDGTDNGVGVVVDGNIDYDNVFVGGYDYGDVQYRNHISTNNNNLIYWKSTKAFADGCSSHFADSFYGTGNLALPDQAAVVFENTRFEGGVHFESGHHCNIGTTGVLCSPMYVFEKCQFDINGNGPAFEFHSEANTYGGIFTLSPPDEANLAGGLFPAGYSTLISSAFPYVLELPAACVKASSLGVAAGVKYADGILCKPTLRSIKIYTFGLTPGTASQLNVEFLKAGKLITSFKRPYHQVGLPIGEKQGYAFPAFIGADVEYRISLDKPGSPNIPADWVIEFSDPIFGNRWGKEVVKLTVAGRTCPPLTSSQHDRKFIYADSDHYLGVKAHGRGACSVHPDSPAKTCPAKTTIDSVTCPSKCPGECNNGFCDCGLQKCMCSPGFSGPNCEIDTCAAGRCGVHGRCAAKYLGGSIPVNEGACICEPGWSGPLCDQNCNAGICEAPIATIPDAECTKDGDFCTSVPGGLCKAGACVAPATPVTDAECINDGDVCTSIAGGLCKAGACVAPDAECANDGDACTSILGGSCEAGICVAPDIPVNDEKCTKDGDACSSFVGGICNAGICVAPATSVPDAECTKDGDACTSVPGGSCQTGKCVASLVLPVGTECANDDDVCASVPGGLCKAGACVAPATPVTDAECINDGDVCTSIAGGLCNAGICVAPAAPIIDAECINDGDICTSIAGGSCKAGVCVALMASVPDAECAKDGDACSSIEGGQCKSGECVAPVTPTGEDECIQEGASCTSIDGGVCKAGECVAPETPTTDEECTRDGASCTSVDGGICQSGKCLSVLTECDNAADNQPCTSVKGGKCSGGICKAAKPFPTHHVPKPHDCRNLHL